MKLCIASVDGKVIIPTLKTASSLRERVVGLLGKSSLAEGEALHIKPCGSIHTFGMKFSLDLIFLDSELRVCETAWNVSPNRMVLGGISAKSVIEVESGWINANLFSTGVRLDIDDVTRG